MSESGGAGASAEPAPSPGVSLSLVIPAFNEGQRLDEGVGRLAGRECGERARHPGVHHQADDGGGRGRGAGP